jgi:hypothetical protein
LQEVLCQQRRIIKNLLYVAEIVDRTRAAQADDVPKLLAGADWDEDALAYLAAGLHG